MSKEGDQIFANALFQTQERCNQQPTGPNVSNLRVITKVRVPVQLSISIGAAVYVKDSIIDLHQQVHTNVRLVQNVETSRPWRQKWKLTVAAPPQSPMPLPLYATTYSD